MSIDAIQIQEAIVSKLNTVENMGVVETKSGRATKLPWEDRTSKIPKPLFTVKLKSAMKSRDTKSSMGSNPWDYVWSIYGVFPHNYSASSDTTWMKYITDVLRSFKNQPAIEICAKTDPIILLENHFAMYNAQSGAVEVHYALFELTTQVWVNNKGD